ncbi:hypothetical protein LTR09_000162 [Extremus antarcticus]|uniref:Uncharacterized protein n=1 Tax=Extremus antarcticus TaxID=702011 RepID=A0AAJ0GJA5_9PEZI|nr:hypothetical protein LTR09_000162 [Extremus antarcticus]
MSTNQLATAVGSSTPRLTGTVPATDFPKFMELPAEMRDLIYGFLVKGRKVRGPIWRHRPESERSDVRHTAEADPSIFGLSLCANRSKTVANLRQYSKISTIRARSDARTYRFQTNILLANRMVHYDALKVLRLRNTFIKFTFTWLDEDNPLEFLYTHTTFQSLRKIKPMPIRFHTTLWPYICTILTAPQAENVDAEDSEDADTGFRTSSVILLAKDLAALCQSIRLNCTLHYGAVTLLLKDWSGRLRAFTGSHVERPFELVIELHKLHDMESLGKRAKRCLSPLQYPLIPALKITETSAKEELMLPPGALSRFRASAGPDRIWVAAWAYRRFDLIHSAMLRHNEFIRRGELKITAGGHWYIWDTYFGIWQWKNFYLFTSDASGEYTQSACMVLDIPT